MRASTSMRIWFAFVGTILWTGIYLTGFSKANWVLYVPAAGFILGAVTGLCPSLTVISKIFIKQPLKK
ncbi:hypothetical protein [Mucilaginibacter sp. BT774]|uniref:hypothetical protein n=1 Tax=Mucilaginibacter sp. BT774 TaxID=3062276 RepID=UPI002675FC7E|nr:hypothetical protein [Mucilaginibacter sp. BT774]MDO3626718.1 hypothetical protein [Mucilaginibacter sp. BT774]